MNYEYGLGKPRSKFGKFLDRQGIGQMEFAEECGLGRNTISRLCNQDDIGTHEETLIKVIRTLRKNGYDVTIDDFW